jgi:hypothetical protein
VGDDRAPDEVISATQREDAPGTPGPAPRAAAETAGCGPLSEEIGPDEQPDPDEPSAADFADPPPEEVRPREGWRKRTATGAILSGLALAFQQVFEDHHQDVSVIMETSGVPPTDLPVEAEFDHMAPRRSVVKIRPWLLGDPEAGDAEAGDAEASDPEAGDDEAGDAKAGDRQSPESQSGDSQAGNPEASQGRKAGS